MLERILGLLERYVESQEKIADRATCGGKTGTVSEREAAVPQKVELLIEETFEKPVEVPATTPTEIGEHPPSIEALRDECTELGIPWRSNASRSTLIKKIEKAKDVVKANTDSLVTVEECREIAMRYHTIASEEYHGPTLVKQITGEAKIALVAEWLDEEKRNAAYANLYKACEDGINRAIKAGLKNNKGGEI